ncbi:MAG: hypothetical protein FJZ87_15415 [Chloroflexi bacterium]|nr:hypothetical protein [Chloroflexota bacterium]
MNLPIPESYWVIPGRFLAGEYPTGFDAHASQERLERFLEAGINTFYDLTHSHELTPYESLLTRRTERSDPAITYRRFPVRDHSIPTRATMVSILDALDQALNSGRNIYLHCWGGIGRTGMAVACHLVRQGYSNEKALAKVQQWFVTMPKSAVFQSSPETSEQVRFVREWREQPNAGLPSGDNP